MNKLYAATMVSMLFLVGEIAQATDSACARVTIEIAQELTLERVAFDPKLVIHNNSVDARKRMCQDRGL